MSTPEQGYSEEGRPRQTEVSGLEAKVGVRIEEIRSGKGSSR